MMTLLLFGLLALDPKIANIQTPSQIEEANQLFENGQFAEAKQRYEQALKADPDNGAIAYNLANAHAALGDTEQAQEYYRKAIQSKDPNAAANAKYNLGNLMMKQQQMDKAVEQYIEYLTEHPNDIDAKRNLELALKQLEQQQQQQQDDQQQSSDENQEGEQQQDDQQSSDGNQGDEQQQDQQQSQQSQGDQENQDEQQSQQSQGDQEEQEEQQSQAQDQQEQDEQSADEQQQQNQQDPNQMSQARIQQIMEALKDQELEAQREMQQRKLGPPKRRSKDW